MKHEEEWEYNPDFEQEVLTDSSSQHDHRGKFKVGNTYGDVAKFGDPERLKIVKAQAAKKRAEMQRRFRIATADLEQANRNIEEFFPSGEMGQRLNDVYEMAMKMRSPKTALAVLEFVMAYQYGKPVNRQFNVNATMDEFRKLFKDERSNDDGDDSPRSSGDISAGGDGQDGEGVSEGEFTEIEGE